MPVIPPLSIVDVHCHSLPGLDDGPAYREQSIALCGKLAAEEVEAIVASAQ